MVSHHITFQFHPLINVLLKKDLYVGYFTIGLLIVGMDM
jgi:hypothetical protein